MGDMLNCLPKLVSLLAQACLPFVGSIQHASSDLTTSFGGSCPSCSVTHLSFAPCTAPTTCSVRLLAVASSGGNSYVKMGQHGE